MKCWKIFSFEFAYLVRRITTWLYLAVILLFTILMNLLTTPGDGVYANNTFHITAMTAIGCLVWLMMGATTAGEAAARDVMMRMHPLTYSTPVTKLHYLGGRFLATFFVNALLVLFLPLGVLASFYLPGQDQDVLLPFRPWAYFSVYLLIALPNAFIATAIQFSFAVLGRKVMTSYLASLLLALVAQIIAISLAKLFGNWDLVKLLDPVGVTGIVGNELATWTPTEKNTRLVTLDGLFLWNRVLWLSVAAGALLLTYARFNTINIETNSWWSRLKWRSNLQNKPVAEPVVTTPVAIAVPHVQVSFGIATHIRQMLRIAGASFTKMARHPMGFTLVAIVAVVSVVFSKLIIAKFGIPLVPTNWQMIDYLANPVGDLGSPWVVIPLLIVYFTGALVWQERDAGLSDIADAAPVPGWVLLTGKFLGLAFIIIAWMALLMACGIGMQLSQDYHTLQVGVYLQALFGFQLIDYLLFAFLSLVIHVVINQKYISYLMTFLAFIYIAFPSIFNVEHPMFIFGADPGWSYTDMRGFGSSMVPWLWFKIYWIGCAMLLAVAARLLWARGKEQSLKHRLGEAKRRYKGSTTRFALIAAGLVLSAGSFIFYNTNVRNEYRTSNNINERKAAYERRYSQYRNTPQPQLIATKLQVEIYPYQQQIDIHAAYTLVNDNTVPIDSIHLGSASGIAPVEVKFNRPVATGQVDKALSHHIYILKQPLQPGDSVQLNFVIHYQQQGFLHSGTNALVVKNGTSFTNYDLLPAIGYQRYRELTDGGTRKKYGLAERPSLPSLYDAAARKKPLIKDQVIFDAVVGTSTDEVAVAPGILQRTWTAGDRRYFHYKTEDPIGGEYAFLSSKYAVQESKWEHVAIKIYYHPDHSRNVARMLNSVKTSLAYYTAQFGAYPFNHLTIVEQAGSGNGASADPSMIRYGEHYALMNPDTGPGGFDLPYYILAHEVAHQWWGIARLAPANVEGAGVLIEGLAVYSGMQVLQEHYGETHLRKYLDYLHASYEMPRSLASASLLQANETFLYYRKGGLALYALSKYIGKEKVNTALKELLQKHTPGELTLPTTLDLYQEIQKVTPDSLNYLLSDLFEKNTYWRLKTKQFAAEQDNAGTWNVTLKVQAQKVVVDSTGRENEVPMNDWLEVGLYEKAGKLSKPLYLKMHRIRSGEQTIKVTVPRKPDLGGIDPNHLVIDLRLDDNMMEAGQ